MDALKAVKLEKCRRCTISVHISKRIWSLRNCKTEDTSKLSGLQASVYRMNGNLQYSHDVVLLQNSYRGRGGDCLVCFQTSLLCFLFQLILATWEGGYNLQCQNLHSAGEADIRVRTATTQHQSCCKQMFTFWFRADASSLQKPRQGAFLKAIYQDTHIHIYIYIHM